MRKFLFVTFAALVAAVSCSKEDPTLSPAGPEAIDLGLSVNWASFNVGATKPEEYGTYFAWGDVTGQTWDGSKWSGRGFSATPKFKIDANGNLKPEYDAAHVNLGSSWRMPTKAEQQELIDNCTSTWEDNYQGTGVAGRIFTSKINGNCIFLPAAGGGDCGELHDAATCGKYWSGSYGVENAWYLRFSSEDIVMYNYSCHYGRPVRAVADKSAPDPSNTTDLSAPGTANCYVVPSAGNYKFKATVKGNSTESVGTPTSAEVIWESFGTSTNLAKGKIIKNVSLQQDGYVRFSTPTTLANGNAVIAVKDASRTILWSWHIWVCKDFYPSVSAQVYNNNAGIMMDRNLGATSVTMGDVHALGLNYQWGRKDPFLNSSDISISVVAVSTLSWPSVVVSDATTGTIAYTVSHPTTFITRNSYNGDWYYTGSASTDDTRWQTTDKEKGMYDPCPAGWRVPDGGENGVWFKALGSSTHYENDCWSLPNRGSDLGSGNGSPTNLQLGSAKTIWYPAAGMYFSDDGQLALVGFTCGCWSCTPVAEEPFAAFNFEFDNSRYGYLYPYLRCYRAYGCSVRCILD